MAMRRPIRNILLLYTDPHYLVKPVYPFGLDLIAHALRRCGYKVVVEYPFVPDPDPENNLAHTIQTTRPDLIGLGIRNIDTTMSCEPFGNVCGDGFRARYFLPEIRRITRAVRRFSPGTPVVAGGVAFSVSPEALLQYLDLEFGITGDGVRPLKRFVQAYPDRIKIEKIPGMVFRTAGGIRKNPPLPFSFESTAALHHRDRRFNYAHETAGIPVQTKRGCHRRCAYCVEPLFEGRRYVFRDPSEIISELSHLTRHHPSVQSVFFTDTEFNLPDADHATRLLEKIRRSPLNGRLRFAAQFLPRPFPQAFAELLAEVGFSVILTGDSFADAILKNSGISHSEADLIRSIELCERLGLDCTVNMIFGLPGETRATLEHTVARMGQLPPHALRRYEYTYGARIYRGTDLCRLVEKNRSSSDHVFGNQSEGYLEPCYFCSPWNPMQMRDTVQSALSDALRFRTLAPDLLQQKMAVAHFADRNRWQDAAQAFYRSGGAVRTDIYDYIFRKLAEADQFSLARGVSEAMLETLSRRDAPESDRDRIAVIHHYLRLLPPDTAAVP